MKLKLSITIIFCTDVIWR